jgi:hypothetical protein
VPFTLTDPASVSALNLRLRYDDGVVAYLNGQKVAERNAPEAAITPVWPPLTGPQLKA